MNSHLRFDPVQITAAVVDTRTAAELLGLMTAKGQEADAPISRLRQALCP